MGLINVKIMIPFVRTVTEAQSVVELLAQQGLTRQAGGLQVLRRWMFDGPRPMQRRLTTLTCSPSPAPSRRRAWWGVALRATLVDNNQRKSLLIARDLD